MAQDQGQAGAQIEITSEMMSAGFDAFWSLDIEEVGSIEIIRAVYLAMTLVKEADYSGNLAAKGH
jgi:hypothetical protein